MLFYLASFLETIHNYWLDLFDSVQPICLVISRLVSLACQLWLYPQIWLAQCKSIYALKLPGDINSALNIHVSKVIGFDSNWIASLE